MRVGIIGGGISGLAAARNFFKSGIECVVFDTGKRGPGGRCSSRLAADTGFPGAVDHAAQFLESTGASPAFDAFVGECVDGGALKRWDDGGYGGGGRSLYVGSADRGIGAAPEALAADVDLRSDVWVAPANGVKRKGGMWTAHGEAFDALIIAHNGKCAERLTSTLPAPAIKKLCRAAFGSAPKSGKMTLNSVYSLVFELPKGSLGEVCAARLDDDASLAYVGNNGAKLGWDAETEVFTALSTSAYGAANKHPQEQLAGTETETRVKTELLEAAFAACAFGGAVVEPLRWKLQLWGAALPLNARYGDAPFAWDGERNIGVVGDWFSTEGGPPPATVEAAFHSGDALAAHVASAPGEDRGLSGEFVASATDFSAAGAPPPPRPPAAPLTDAQAAAKRKKKLRKALKRIGQLRSVDYMTLTTPQRVKVHGEADVLEALRDLGVSDPEAVRRELQPGLAAPMPRSKAWSRERDAEREKVDADAKKRASRERGRRPGDWDCALCNQHNFESRNTCFKCSAARTATAV